MDKHQKLPWKPQCGENQLRGAFIGHSGEKLQQQNLLENSYKLSQQIALIPQQKFAKLLALRPSFFWPCMACTDLAQVRPVWTGPRYDLLAVAGTACKQSYQAKKTRPKLGIFLSVCCCLELAPLC